MTALRARRGLLYMMLAALAFTLMVVALKVAREQLGSLNITIWRSVLALPLVLWFARPSGVGVTQTRLVALRCVLGFAAVYSMTTAALGLSVFDLSILHKLQPLWVVLFAPVFLGRAERPTLRIGGALVLGLVGSVLIVYRGSGDYSPAVVASGAWAVLGTVCSALAHVTLRSLGKTESPRAVVFWFNGSLLPLALVALALPLGDGEPFEWPAMRLLPVLLGVGVFAALGQLLLTTAYKLEKAAATATASYVGPVWAYLADWLIFGTVPGARALLGGALVLSAGVLLVFVPRAFGEANRGSV